MRVLLDTHTWLWMVAEPERLPRRSAELLASPSTEPLLSAASAWEIAIKYQLGRLPLPEPPAGFVPSRMRRSGCEPLLIDHAQVVEAGALPAHHRDPFDRLLVAQARVLRIPICTGDRAITQYEVDVVWG